jgi:hypothetical protein
MNETPLIWTTKGNIPLDDLTVEHVWDDQELYVKFTENHYLGTELVKSSCHVYSRVALGADGIAAAM